MPLQYHIQAQEGDIAPYVLLPGDPGRVEVIAAGWDERRLVASNREFTTYTGSYRGAPITCTSTGIGAPSTAIALEELARLGATTFLRLGTCGAFQDHIHINDLVIFDAAARYDGTSALYAPLEYPAAAHYEVINACITAARGLQAPYHVGTGRSGDSFYARHPRPGSSFNNYWQSNWSHHFEDLKRLNILASEMESGVILVLARIWGLRAGAIALVLDHVLNVMDDHDQFDPQTALAHDPHGIAHLARLGNETIRLLYERDQGKITEAPLFTIK